MKRLFYFIILVTLAACQGTDILEPDEHTDESKALQKQYVGMMVGDWYALDTISNDYYYYEHLQLKADGSVAGRLRVGGKDSVFVQRYIVTQDKKPELTGSHNYRYDVDDSIHGSWIIYAKPTRNIFRINNNYVNDHKADRYHAAEVNEATNTLYNFYDCTANELILGTNGTVAGDSIVLRRTPIALSF